MNCCLMYKLEVGDELYVVTPFGAPLTNLSSYTSDDTLNSFWGIRLDYLKKKIIYVKFSILII